MFLSNYCQCAKILTRSSVFDYNVTIAATFLHIISNLHEASAVHFGLLWS